jgi:N-ethylmaleimide reductase
MALSNSKAGKKITDSVHQAGGKMIVQLWHVGRMSHTDLQPDNGAPVAPSAIAAKAKTVLIKDGAAVFVNTSAPRALRAEELPGIVQTYPAAALRTVRV